MDAESDLAGMGVAEPVIRVFRLKYSKPSRIADLIRPSVSTAGSSVIDVDDQQILIVTDVAERVQRISQLVMLLDTGRPLVDVKFIAVRNVKAAELAGRLKELFEARGKALGREEKAGSGIEVSVEERTNRLILIGSLAEIAMAEQLLEQLDQELPTTPGRVNLRFMSPDRFDEMLKAILDERVTRPPYRSRIEGNALLIESTAEVLQLAEQLRLQFDTREAPEEQSPIRFYKIRNVPAQELLQTVQGIFSPTEQPARRGLPDRRRNTLDGMVPGANYPPIYGSPAFGPLVPLPQTPALRGFVDPVTGQLPTTQVLDTVESQLASPQSQTTGGSANLIGEASVSIDVHSNTLIVVAKPEVQRIYAGLIAELDKRRPQVLVEAKVVIIDTSDDYTLGVEISGGDRSGSRRSFAFTSFGFSQVDPVSGALQIAPGVGFNGTLVDPSTADVVIRALSTHRRARVLSSPRILVNDNAEGELTSVLEIPFTSVNASQTVATTSFAGFAEAGTTIAVTPTISDDDYLQMDYVVTLNAFTGAGANGVPPPRQTNEVRSRVTVPDGYTVIVGGLTSKNDTSSYRGLPVIEKIPVLRDLTGTTSTTASQTSLFVFLRPVILRDDKFKDLKYVSDESVQQACLPGEFPATPSLSIR